MSMMIRPDTLQLMSWVMGRGVMGQESLFVPSGLRCGV